MYSVALFCGLFKSELLTQHINRPLGWDLSEHKTRLIHLIVQFYTLFLSLLVPAPVCPSPPTSSGGVITVRWSYTHTGGLDLTQVVVTAMKGILTTELDVPNGNLTDLDQMYLNISTFTAGFSYIFTVAAYNQLGSSTVQCNPVTHRIGTCQNSFEHIYSDKMHAN